MRDNALTNLYNPEKYIILMFNTVDLVKHSKQPTGYQVFPDTRLRNISHGCKSILKQMKEIFDGSIFHRIHEKDSAIECHLRKCPKITYIVLNPENIRQFVPLAFAFFILTTMTATRQYFLEETTLASFLYLVYNWWL